MLKYEIRGLEDGFVQTVHIPVQRIINEFKSKKKQMFQEKFEAKFSIL